MMMFETSKHVPKTEKRCCVFENKKHKVGKIHRIKLMHEVMIKWRQRTRRLDNERNLFKGIEYCLCSGV